MMSGASVAMQARSRYVTIASNTASGCKISFPTAIGAARRAMPRSGSQPAHEGDWR